MMQCLQKPEEGALSPGAGATGSFALVVSARN